MKKLLLCLILLIAFTGIVSASTIELVVNGEFENPNNGADYFYVNNADMDGWSNSSGKLEIWNQGVLSSPIFGSDGIGTGQHHEVAVDSYLNYTTQNLFAIGYDGLVDFSFDTWERRAKGISYSLIAENNGVSRNLVDVDYYFSAPSDWEAISHLGLSVLAGDILKLRFQTIDGGSSGVHIDQVSLQYAPVPEPATMFLFGLGLLGLAGVNRRKK